MQGTSHLARRGGGGTRFVAAVGLGPTNPQVGSPARSTNAALLHLPGMLQSVMVRTQAARPRHAVQGPPWGPSPYRQLGEQAAVLAKGRRAKSVATMLLSGADTSVPEAVPRRHEHVHDLENRVSVRRRR